MLRYEVPPNLPATRNPFTRFVGSTILRLIGWRIAGEFPDVKRLVVIVAPHTSNWDFPIGLAAKWALTLDAVWIGKHTLFKWPLTPIFRWLGGIPVKRDAAHGVVSQLADLFNARDQMMFVLAPEGTRKPVKHWRSGYWHVAHRAQVPIVPVGFDFALKTIFVGPLLHTTDSLEDDEVQLRRFFAGITPKRATHWVA